jgi:hypothetical protein
MGTPPPPPARPGFVLDVKGTLGGADPVDARGRRYQTYKVQLVARKRYVIEMTRLPGGPDPCVRVQNEQGSLSSETSAGGAPSARINYAAPQTDVYRIVATTSAPNTAGPYALTVKMVAAP